MKRVLFVFLISLVCVGLFATEVNMDFVNLAQPAELSDQFSYVYGYIIMRNVMQAYPDLDISYWAKGMYDTLAGDLRFSTDQMQQILSDYQLHTVEVNAAAQRKLAAANLEKARDFLSINKGNANVKVTESGLQYQVIREGSGARPTSQSNVRVNYQGMLMDGTVFDSSYARKVPSDFSLSSVIAGFREGLQLMTVGSKYRFWIPPELAYGENSTNVEPNSLLVFEVELLGINK